MPEEMTIDLQRALDLLEDPIMEKPLVTSQYYKMFLKALENDTDIGLTVINRILLLCATELQDDKKCSYLATKIISLVLKKIQLGAYAALPNLVPSIMAILNMTKTTALLKKMETMQEMCFETLLLFPDETLIEVASNTSEVTEVLNLYCHQQIPLEIRLLPCPLIKKLLTILPPEKKTAFVKTNLNVWFTKLIPTIFAGNGIDNDTLNIIPLETLETLTDELVSIDYENSPHWQHLFECIYNPQKYPSMMKLMLVNGWRNWHRLWIVCIRLLKNQITRITGPVGSPINSMLPVVETAFKMDVTNRCRAFQCWDVLIDNFHTETNENYIVKRLKLLIIPLKSNNAKVEETALAKLRTWWHLIQRFQTRLDKFIDTVIISFLTYCFGKQKPGFVPGLLSNETKKLSVENFIELTGHLCCTGCVDVPKLNDRIVSKKVLVDFWNDWLYSLKMATILYTESIGVTIKQITCVWKSIVAIVAELPDNNIRKDLFNELLGILENYIKDHKFKAIAVNIIVSLFHDRKMETLFKLREKQGAIYKIMSLILDQQLSTFYRAPDIKYVSSTLKPLASYILDKEIEGSSKLLTWLLNLDENSSQNNVAFVLTPIAECVYELEYKDVNKLVELVLWPFQSKNFFTDIEYCSHVWNKLIDYIYPKIDNHLKDDLATALWGVNIDLNLYLKLHACMVVLNHELKNASVVGYSKMVELLMLITQKVNVNSSNNFLPLLIDTVIPLLKKVKDEKDQILVDHTMIITTNVFKFIIPVVGNVYDNVEDEIKCIQHLLDNIEPILLSTPLYQNLIEILAKFSKSAMKFPEIQKRVTSILKSLSSQITAENTTLKQTILDAINSIECNNNSSKKSTTANVNHEKFAEPDVKIIAKRGKKKETSIVNTVVENGEEFVVVKSNWKFNPRKLTENQKEKFQRKREDIPALYQDLSQSQDEFKLATWKTDSQDTSSTYSKSTSASKSADAGNVSEILKKMPSSDVVPKIIENIFSDKTEAKSDSDKKSTDKKVTADVGKVKQTTPKDPKSPRMALKDRVFRNVRNLIEKSSGQKDGKDLSESLIQVENIPKTPTSKGNSNSTNLVNSAPPNLNAERPSRMKRKPKKFDDVEIFSLKRGRRLSSQTDSHSDSSSPTMVNEIGNDGAVQKEKNDYNVIKNKDDAEKSSSNSSADENIIQTVAVIENIPSKAATSPQSETTETPTVLESMEKITAEVNNDNEENKKMDLDAECKQTLNEQASKSEIPNERDDRQSDVIILSDNKDVIVLSDDKDPTKSPRKDDATKKESQEKPADNTAATENEEIVPESDKITEQKFVSNNDKIDKTPKLNKKHDSSEPRSAKRSTMKKSRIEKELAIDTVEGHPFLKIRTEKRMTRKNLNSSSTLLLNTSRRKSLSEKLNKSKVDAKTPAKIPKKDKDKTNVENVSVTISESQEKSSEISDDFPLSEDVIESSQDSSITTISVKPTKNTLKKLSVVVQKVPLVPSIGPFATQDLLNTENNEVSTNQTLDLDNKEDSILPQNKTAITDKTDLDLTENMDTQPVDDKDIEKRDDSDVIVINDDDDPVIVVGTETQEIADADTQPMNPADLMETSLLTKKVDSTKTKDIAEVTDIDTNNTMDVDIANEMTTTMNESSVIVSAKVDEDNTASSPFKDEDKRKKDFLDNTLEISPIKTMSPVRDKKSPSPETSSDYVVIMLSSPVQSNGEPFDKCTSPEIFTEDKVSPDKRDLSPPRDEIAANNNSSPSSSLSLKKNRPQVRSGGRAAQMLGLCVPDRLQTIMNSERTETEETKKNSPSTTPARRNLRILYNSVGDTSENTDENKDSENFLKLKRSLPTTDCSPSGPILKRKLAEITDDATMSPASKRKRVSFHDPPVSTTISVQKYIEPCGIRSPQNSATKRQERQNLRSQVILKSPKRLDNVFKLDTVLTKTVESFNESEQSSSDVTQSMSLDETPAVEIIKHSDLNDVDSICPELVDCEDRIELIAAGLSSATMKRMFVKELEGQIATIGDLAKKTELEVNRLCIKAPKIKVAKRVLNDYAAKLKEKVVEVEPIVNAEPVEEVTSPVEAVKVISDKIDVEMQTICAEVNNVEIQTQVPVAVGCVQTDDKIVAHIGAQTNESGVKSTNDLVTSCIAERPDFMEKLGKHLDDTSKLRLAESLPFDAITDMFMENVTNANTNSMITRILSKQTGGQTHKVLSHLQEYLSERFDNRDLILFCSQLLAKVHDKS